MQNVKQATAKPTRKVSFAGLGAIVGTMAAAAMNASGVPFLTNFIAYPGVESAIGGGCAFAFAYLVRERLS